MPQGQQQQQQQQQQQHQSILGLQHCSDLHENSQMLVMDHSLTGELQKQSLQSYHNLQDNVQHQMHQGLDGHNIQHLPLHKFDTGENLPEQQHPPSYEEAVSGISYSTIDSIESCMTNTSSASHSSYSSSSGDNIVLLVPVTRQSIMTSVHQAQIPSMSTTNVAAVRQTRNSSNTSTVMTTNISSFCNGSSLSVTSIPSVDKVIARECITTGTIKPGETSSQLPHAVHLLHNAAESQCQDVQQGNNAYRHASNPDQQLVISEHHIEVEGQQVVVVGNQLELSNHIMEVEGEMVAVDITGSMTTETNPNEDSFVHHTTEEDGDTFDVEETVVEMEEQEVEEDGEMEMRAEITEEKSNCVEHSILNDLLDEGDDDPQAYHHIYSGDYDMEEQFMMTSCIDDKWTEEQLLQLIDLHGSKTGWRDRANHALLYQELTDELELSNDIPWMQVQQKWLQLYTIYSKIQDHMQTGDITEAPQCVLFEQLKSAEERQLTAEDDTSSTVASTTTNNNSSITYKIRRKSPEFMWSSDITREFIKMRADKHAEIQLKGHNAVYEVILAELGLTDRVTVLMARKKWNYLVNRYQDECAAAGGGRPWSVMADMAKVMARFTGLDASKLKSRASPEFLWPNELTVKFIDLRVAKQEDIIKIGIQRTFASMLQELGLGHILTPNHLRKKWNYLIGKHKELSSSCCSDGPGTQAWPFYDRMTEALKILPAAHRQDCAKHDNIWTHAVLLRFIALRADRSVDDARNASSMFSEILADMKLSDVVQPLQARKKWNNLCSRYQALSQVGVSDFARNSWPYYAAMRDVVAGMPCLGVGNGISDVTAGDASHTDEELEHKPLHRKPRTYTCFMCNITGKHLAEYYIFEHDQRLLHTQKTVLEVIGHLLGKKLVSLEATTMLCSRCTHLVNEADAVINRHDKIKQEVVALYEQRLSQFKQLRDQNRRSCEITIDGDQVASPSVEIEVKSDLNFDDDIGLDRDDASHSKSIITYSKRGRKRKSTVFSDSVQKCVKLEPTEDGSLTSIECDVELNDSFEELIKPRKKSVRGRGRGRGRGRRGRGRPTIRSTLIGRGLEGQYPTNNKRGSMVMRGPKLYNCSECKEQFKRYTDLVGHRKDVHTVIDNTPLEVEETVLESGIITYFNKDKANSTNTSHPCKECSKVFLRKDDLSYHQEVFHTDGKGRAKSAFKDKSYSCEECGDTFLFKYKLKLHINNKHLNDAGVSANDFTCGDCGSKLGSLPGLTFHMRKHHDKVLNYKKSTAYLCNTCGFMATSSKKLKDHQEAYCTLAAKEQVQCEICGKTVLKVSLKMHRIKMHSEFKEQCDRCGERYATKTDLLRHINVVHLNILLYYCKECQQRFPTSDSLRYHRVKMHEKPAFFCHICSKSYKRVGELNTHVKRAHNDRRKAEVCSYCGKEYYDRSGLRNHLVSKHNVPQELTYSDNYLRKKRVDGLPLAKHLEKRIAAEESKQEMEIISSQQLQQMMHNEGHVDANTHQHHVHSTAQMDIHQQQGLVDEATVAARTLVTYNNGNNAADADAAAVVHEEDSSLVVTEITENTTEQQIIVDPLGNIIHHPMQANQHHHHHTVHHHHHQQQQQHNHYHQPQQIHHTVATTVGHHNHHPAANIPRLGVIYQINGQQHTAAPNVGHINM